MEGKTQFVAEDLSTYRITDVEGAQAALRSGSLEVGEASMLGALLSFEDEGAEEVFWDALAERYEEFQELATTVHKL